MRPLAARAQHAVVIARERQSVGTDDSKSEFDIELAVPAMFVDEAQLLQVCSLTPEPIQAVLCSRRTGHRMKGIRQRGSMMRALICNDCKVHRH